jgi:hypothetical protein
LCSCWFVASKELVGWKESTLYRSRAELLATIVGQGLPPTFVNQTINHGKSLQAKWGFHLSSSIHDSKETKSTSTTMFCQIFGRHPQLDLPPTKPRKKALNLSQRALVGKFTSLWPSPKVVETWVVEQWSPKINGQVTTFVSRRGFYVFLFLNMEERGI